MCDPVTFVCVLLSVVIGLLVYIAVVLTNVQRTMRGSRLNAVTNVHNFALDQAVAAAAVERAHRRLTLARQRGEESSS